MKAKSRKAKQLNGIAGSSSPIQADKRQRMIAEAAYFRALQRNFQDGDALEDWCSAEREIDHMLLSVEIKGEAGQDTIADNRAGQTPTASSVKPELTTRK